MDCTVQIADYLLELYRKDFSYNYLIYNGVKIYSEIEQSHTDIISKIDELKKDNQNIILTYSGIVKRKGLYQIIKVLKKIENFSYICIGDGPEKKKLQRLVTKSNLQNKVFFYDFIKKPYLLIDYVDIFAIPSFSEGFSLALLEAGLQGASVVCSEIPSFTKSFTADEVTFFHLKNISSLKNAFNEALINKQLKKENLKEKIISKYNQEIMLSKYEQLYINLLNSK